MTAEPDQSERLSGWHLPEHGSSALTEVNELCGNYFGLCIELERPAAHLLSWFRAGKVGAVTVGELRLGDEVRIVRREPVAAYLVYVPLTGRMTTEHGGVVGTGSIGRAIVHRPFGPATVDRIRPFTTILLIRFDRAAVEHQLQLALDRPVRGPVEVAPWLDLTCRRGQSWLGLMRLLLDDAGGSDGVAADPTTAERLSAGAMAGFLSAAEHPFRTEMNRPNSYRWPRPVRRAVTAMLAEPAYPFSVVDLARAGDVSVRALQVAFHRHLGMSPMAYLRELRLGRVHDDLLRGVPDSETVADVAHRWGFTHLGRFAAAYRRVYGVSPSVTLRT